MDPEPRPAVSVVVPLLDEGATANELLDRLDRTLCVETGGYEVVLVDDGSSPSELHRLRDAAAGRASTRVVELSTNRGQVVALICGLANAQGQIVVTMDGDLQDPPEEIPSLLEAIRAGAQVATARRAAHHGGLLRRWGSRAVSRVAGLLTGVPLADYGGQFNAYDRSTVDLLVQRWRARTPILPLACSTGATVQEVPVRCDPRPVGSTRYGPGVLGGIVAELVVAFVPARRIRPSLLCTTVALATLALVAARPWRSVALLAASATLLADRKLALRYRLAHRTVESELAHLRRDGSDTRSDLGGDQRG